MSLLARLKAHFRRAAGANAPGPAPADAAGWHEVGDYFTLARLVRQAHFPDQQAFLAGPFSRFLDLVAAAPGRPGARIMEHARASLSRFSDREQAAGRPVDGLEEAADRLVRARFASGSDNDAYMIEVFEGRATHNYRASDEEED